MIKQLLFTAGLLAATTLSVAQKKIDSVKYRRSSLYTIMMPDLDLKDENLKAVKAIYKDALLPDKYNEHNLEVRFFDPSRVSVTEEEIASAKGLLPKEGAAKKALGFASGLLKSTATAVKDEAADANKTPKMKDEEAVAKILKYFEENKVAHKLVSKWYRGDKGGTFAYDLIAERGLYNASAQELAIAAKSKLGENKIMDGAALELIPSTYVLVSMYSYLSAEELASDVAALATTGAALLGGGTAAQATSLGVSALGSVFKGYFVKTTSYLFQLEWDKSIQEDFEKNYYNMTQAQFLAKAPKDAFRLKLVGKTTDNAPATLKITLSDKNDQALVERATVRATDGAIAKLSKKYVAFRPKVAVQVDGEEITARIGKKEGLSGGEEFAVYEQVMQEDGSVKYDKVTTIKVIKGKVWDNRYAAGKQIEGGAKEEITEEMKLDRTYFKGSPKKIMSGMIIQQVK